MGRADLHIHSLASDGVSSVAQILDHAQNRAKLDVIAITDHERVDAAHAARAMAEARGMSLEVIVGEEVTHARRSRRGTVHDRAHPAVGLAQVDRRPGSTSRAAWRSSPTRSCPIRCAPARRSIQRLLDEQDPIFHPDGIEAFNPTTAGMRWGSARARVRRADRSRAARRQRRSPRRARGLWRSRRSRATAQTTCAARSSSERQAGKGSTHEWKTQFSTFRRQMGKNALAVRDEVRGKLTARRDRSRSGLSGRPAASGAARRSGLRGRGDQVKIGLVTPYIYPLPGGVNAHVHDLYEHLVAHGHDVRIISSIHGPQRSQRGRHHPPGLRLLRADQRLRGHADVLAALHAHRQRHARARALRHPALPRAVRAVPVARAAARVEEHQHRDVPRLCGLEPGR